MVKAEKEFNLVKVSREAKSLVAPGVCLLLPGKTEVALGEDIVMTLGASVAPLWAVATMLDCGGNILESRMVTMDGSSAGSLRELRFRYPAGADGPVSIQLLFFKYGRFFKYEHTYNRLSMNLICLWISAPSPMSPILALNIPSRSASRMASKVSRRFMTRVLMRSEGDLESGKA